MGQTEESLAQTTQRVTGITGPALGTESCRPPPEQGQGSVRCSAWELTLHRARPRGGMWGPVNLLGEAVADSSSPAALLAVSSYAQLREPSFGAII